MTRRGPTKPREWGEWQELPAVIGGEKVERVVQNNLYHVIVRRQKDLNGNWPDMLWLSIRRTDKKVVRDWRHLQRIKNELVGENYEGMEMFPAEERLVDAANQYHLFVVDERKFRWPWGYRDRLTSDPEQAESLGAKQRPFEDV